MRDRASAWANLRARRLLSLAALAALAVLGLALPALLDNSPPIGTVLLNPPALGSNGRVNISWRANARTPRFLVEVRSADRIPRFAASSEMPALQLPADVSGEIVDGSSLVWTVTALDADGHPTGASATEALGLQGSVKRP
ncbi:MAG: hypothetical protein LC791_12390 [Acidobacteria bacterium]|nr:hypothetical protein [Acidobacteriota bacterium]